VIELALAGYTQWRRRITVRAGESQRLRADLEPALLETRDAAPDAAAEARLEYGLLTVETSPPSTVYLDGRELGRTPVSGEEVRTGELQLTFVLDDGRRFSRAVRVLAGRTTRRSFDLLLDEGPTIAPPTPSQRGPGPLDATRFADPGAVPGDGLPGEPER
jgi:hypothetical protein